MKNFHARGVCPALACALAAVAVLAGCSGSGSGGSSSAAEGDVPSTGATIIGATSASASPGASAQSLAQRVSTWVATYGNAAITELDSDLEQLKTDLASPHSASTGPACSKIATDVTDAEEQPPDPDSQQELHWFAALQDLQSSSQACTAGVDGPNPSLLSQASAYISRAESELATLRSEINSL